MPRIFTDADVDRMVDLYEAGQSMREIAKQMACSRGSVRNYLHRRGIKSRSRGGSGASHLRLDYDELKQIADMYLKEEMSLHEIGRRLSLPPATVRGRLLAFGVPLRSVSEANRLSWRQHRENILRKREARGFQAHLNIKRIRKIFDARSKEGAIAQLE